MTQTNELLELMELASKHGISYGEIVKGVGEKILLEYYKRYDNTAKDAELVIDAGNGKIRILTKDKEVTPADFQDTAIKIIQSWLMTKIDNGPQEMAPIKMKIVKEGSLTRWFPGLFFWGYNLFFVFLTIIWCLTLTDGTARESVWAYVKELNLIERLILTVLLATPIVSIASVIRKKIASLGKFFFLFEVPTVFLSLVLLMIPEKMIPPLWLFGVIALVLPLYLYLQSEKEGEVDGGLKLGMSFVFSEVLFLMSGYLTVLWSFVVPLIIGNWIKSLGYRYLGEMTGAVLYLFLSLVPVFIGLLLITLPYIISGFLGQMWLVNVQRVIQVWSRKRAETMAVVVSVALILVTIGLSYQPNQEKLLEQMASFGEEKGFDTKEKLARELIPQKKKMKETISDIYDARSRYPFMADDFWLAREYGNIGLGQMGADVVQAVFNSVAYPFVYRGTSDRNTKVSDYYYDLFGEYWNDEKSYSVPETKQVNLVNRNITVNSDNNGLTALVSIEDEFTNKSYQQEEVIYEFSLPNEAAINDLKLGPNLEFEGVVAPKGAAQKTYQAELQRRRDPALLEQIGLSYYRLRVFPIPARNDMSLGGKNQRVKFSYVVGATKDGFPLPLWVKNKNLEISPGLRINASIDGKYENISGEKRYISNGLSRQKVLCEIGASSARLVSLKEERGMGVDFECDSNFEPKLTKAAKGLVIDILYDVSYENKDLLTLKKLKGFLNSNSDLLSSNTVNLYRFNEYLSSPIRVTETKVDEILEVVNFGKSDWTSAMRDLRDRPDMIIVVTGNKGKGVLGYPQVRPEAPLYFLYNEGHSGYMEPNLADTVVQTKGGVVYRFEEAINQFVYGNLLTKKSGKSVIWVGPYWSLQTEGQGDMESWPTITKEDQLGALMVKGYLMKSLSENNQPLSTQVDLLDKYHRLAKKGNVVYFYSSLLALVNETQRQNLEENSKDLGRYKEETMVENRGGGSIMIRPSTGAGWDSLTSMSLSSPGTMMKSSGIMSPAFGGSGIIIAFGGMSAVLAVGTVFYLIKIARKRKS